VNPHSQAEGHPAPAGQPSGPLRTIMKC